MTPRILRAAVIGARIGRLHASALHALPQAEVRWVCDKDLALAQRVAGEHGNARATYDYDLILADREVDLVTIAVPHHLHFDFIRKAIDAGKHVAVEKPICNTLAELDQLIELRRVRAGRIGVIFQNRFSEAARQFVSCVRGGTIGDILLANLSLKWFRAAGYFAVAPWRAQWATAGGGVLTTQTIHYLDLLQAAVGLPSVVEARTATLAHDIEVEDTAVVTGRFAAGGLFSAVATLACQPEEPAYIQVIGSKGSACLTECRGRMSFAMSIAGEAGSSAPLMKALAALGEIEPQDGTFPIQMDDDGHRAFFAAFVPSVLGNEKFEMDEREARKTTLLLDAIYRAARQGGPIAVDGGSGADRLVDAPSAP